MQKFDILIVGGGIVGLTTALAIRKLTTLTVAIVDTAELTPLSLVPETRVSAINIASQQLFENLGVWQKLLNCDCNHTNICMYGTKLEVAILILVAHSCHYLLRLIN